MNTRILFSVIAAMLVVCPAFAVGVCAKDSIVTVVLDPTIGGSGYAYNNEAGVWKTNFSYGTITGISTCQSVKGSSMGDYSIEITANGGENNGQYCWCKMTHPMASRWVFNFDYGSAANCQSNCARNCGNYAQFREALRVGLFGSVAP